MAVRTRRLTVSGPSSSVAGVTVYTCPVGRTAVLKSYGLMTVQGGTLSSRVVLRTAGSSTGMTLHATTLPDGEADWTHGAWVVLHAGDYLVLQNLQGTGQVRFSAHGALLLGDPV